MRLHRSTVAGVLCLLIVLLTGTAAFASDPPPPGTPPPCSGAPVQIGAGALSETLGVAGGTLTTSNGTWSASVCPPTDYSYRWYRDGTLLSAASQSYSPAAVDVEHTLTVQVSGCNGYGCSAWYSDSNSSKIYESALGLRRQYTTTTSIAIDDQESLQVNVADGNLVLQANDFSLPGVAGFGYQYVRSYNGAYSTLSPSSSELSNPNPLLAPSAANPNWEYVANLSFFTTPSTGDARYTDADGHEITFTKSGSTFTPPPGSDATLVLQGDGTYLLTFYKTGMEEKFNASGQLIDEYDRNSNTIAFSWSSGQLSTVTDTTGRATTFHYTSGQMTSITAPCSYANLAGTASASGGSLATGTYYYEVTAIGAGGESTVTSEIQKAVTGPSGKISLIWHAAPGATSYRIYRGTTAGGENVYYTSSSNSFIDTGAAGTSGSPPALSGTCTYAYTYSGGQLATFTDPATGQATTYGYNSSGLLSSVQNPRNYLWEICYDSQNRVSWIQGGLTATGSCSTPGSGTCPTGGVCPTTTFAYTAAPNNDCSTGMETDVTDPSGYLTAYCTDGRARVYLVTDPTGHTTFTDYTDTALGGANCVASGVTLDDQACATEDALGYVTQYGYDASGENLSWGQNPLQTSALRSSWTYGYSSHPYLPSAFTDANGHQTAYTYDSNGNVSSITSGLNASGSCPTGTVCPRTDTSYGSNGELQWTKLGLDSTDACAANTPCSRTDYAYYPSNSSSGTIGDLSSTTTGLTLIDTCTLTTCPETTYTYDAAGNQTSSVDPRGNASGGNPNNFTQNSAYDEDGRLLTSQDELNNLTSYSYDAAGNQATTTDPNGYLTCDSYDANNRLLAETTGLAPSSACPTPLSCPSGSTCPTTSYVYYANGNIHTTTDPNGNTTTDCYNTDDELSIEYSPLAGSVTCGSASSYETQYGYDADGNQTSVVDPNGDETLSSYSDGTTGAYASVGEVISQQSGLAWNGSTYACPASPAICPTTTYSYDLVGNQLTVLDPLGHMTSSGYDPENRVNWQQSGETLDPHTGDYDCVSGTTCPTTAYTFDAEGNTATVLNPMNYETKYSYDFSGNRLSEQSGLNSSGSCPSGSSCPTTSFTYDPNGDLATKTVPDSSTAIDYFYDNAGELTSTIYPTGDTRSDIYYTYDGDGNQTSAASGYESTSGVCSSAAVACQTSTFGNTDQLTGETTADTSGSASYSYTYDANGNTTAEQYPDGTHIYSVYTADNQLCLTEEYTGSGSYTPPSSCTSTPSGYGYTTYSYDNAGNLTTTIPKNTSGSTVQTETRTYDTANFLKEIKTVLPGTGSTTLADVQYTFNNAGMPTTIARTGNVATNGHTINCTVDDSYDNNERVTSAYYHTSSTCPHSNITYSYSWDANGNRLSTSHGGTPTTYAYNNLDELCNQYLGTGASCSSPPTGSTIYSYDGDGNESSDGTNQYAYTLDGHLCVISTSTGQTCDSAHVSGGTYYSYDGSGNLYTVTAGTAPTGTYLLWDPNSSGTPQLDEELSGALTGGTLNFRYVYGDNTRISETWNNGGTLTPLYYTHDGLGSVLNVTTATGASDIAYAYNTFGPKSQTWNSISTSANEMQFTGQRLDPGITSTYDTPARTLDTSVGRFYTQDPAGNPGQTAGTYLYANDNPDTYSDPTGAMPDGQGIEPAGPPPYEVFSHRRHFKNFFTASGYDYAITTTYMHVIRYFGGWTGFQGSRFLMPPLISIAALARLRLGNALEPGNTASYAKDGEISPGTLIRIGRSAPARMVYSGIWKGGWPLVVLVDQADRGRVRYSNFYTLEGYGVIPQPGSCLKFPLTCAPPGDGMMPHYPSPGAIGGGNR